MLVAIAIEPKTGGRLRAQAPDFSHCDLEGKAEPELLPRLRLAIEGEITRLLLAGHPLPDCRDGEPPAGKKSGVRWLTVHINVDHLRALARHQAGR